MVAQIPKGKVLTYGRIAKIIGYGGPRWIGKVLHENSDGENIPCHRVVCANGELALTYAFGGIEAQREKLIAEGVYFKGEKVDMEKSLWK